jgi:hypothetical protein
MTQKQMPDSPVGKFNLQSQKHESQNHADRPLVICFLEQSSILPSYFLMSIAAYLLKKTKYLAG